MKYASNTVELQKKASRLMPLGVNSNGRFWGNGNTPYFQKAKGSRLWDYDGKEFIDYRLAFGPVILGYAYDEVDENVIKTIKNGITPGITSELEVSVAEKIVDLCPAIEMVRLVNTGTEATMHALRVARAYTGREKIIKFEGGYHGSHDYLLYSTYADPKSYGNRRDPIPIPASSGIPKSLQDLIITLPFNDREALSRSLESNGGEIAGIVTEPMLGNYGLAEPRNGYLDFLREKCDEYGILLILDEVKTGFRIARGGAHEFYNIAPDLTAYAKALGNGYPIAAYGGKREIMDIVGRGVTQGGTYAGNGVATAAAEATLSVIQREDVHGHLNKVGSKLQTGLQNIFDEAKIPVFISRHPSIFSVSIGIEENWDARDWGESDKTMYKKISEEALSRGVFLDEDPREPLCVSYSHTENDIDMTLEIMKEVVRIVIE